MARPKSVAVWIRNNRQANGWTQVELAKRLGYTNSSSVNQWESDAKKPPEVAMPALERLFGPFRSGPGKQEEVAGLENEGTEFSLWLRSERNRQGLTLAELYDRSGVNISTLSQIENGKIGSPQKKTRDRLSKVLGSKEEPAPAVEETSSGFRGIGDFEEFNPYVDDERPTVAGIYVLYDVSERPVYVGEGGNIRKRIKDHDEKFWFKRPIVETAAYIEISEDKLRTSIEKLLIRFLKSNAVLNKKGVDR